jgi:hypothetical protein
MTTPDEFNLQPQTEFTPHPNPTASKLGVASLTLGIVGIILYLLPFIFGFIVGYIVGSLEAANGVPIPMEGLDTLNVMGWLVSWCGNFLGLVALILGSISITREKKKAFGFIGIVLGTLLTCGCLATVAYNLSRM